MTKDAQLILDECLKDALPGAAVRNALEKMEFGPGRLVLVSAGKAAFSMAEAAAEALGSKIDAGVVITKYGHITGELPGFTLIEAGHPVPDGNSCLGAGKALELVGGLKKEDNVLFLLSGGGSALFEKPAVPLEELADVTRQLLASGASITEINTIRKRLSLVKGGRFALACLPAHVFTVVLSDIVGDPLDMIASGPAYPDSSTTADAEAIAKKYSLKLTEKAAALFKEETPKELENVTTFVTGSVRQLCASAERVCRSLGYEPVTLTSSLGCEAREAGAFLGAIAREYASKGVKAAFLAGGETVVHLTGHGKGGRNQEIALAAAQEIEGLENVCVFSFGSDGTDGPTDAAGGFADGNTAAVMREKGFDIAETLHENNAYEALKAADGLIVTGPTGTNVNDLSVVLVG